MSPLKSDPIANLFDRIIFFHITKCAGTSIEKAFTDHYGDASVLLKVTKDDYLATPPQYIDRYKVLAGHINHDTAVPFITQSTVLITVFRDPKSRLRSLYNYFHFNESEYEVVQLAKRMDFLTWLTCNEPAVLVQIQSSAARQFTPESYWQIHNAANPELISWYMKKFIDRFALIGFFDRLDDFSEQLHKLFGIEFNFWLRTNKSHDDLTKDVSDAVLDEWLRDKSSFDLQLYDYVRERYILSSKII